MEQLATLNRLKSIQLGTHALTNDGVRHLGSLPDLTHLDLTDCVKIDDGVFDHLAKLRSLTYLSLQYVKITDNGLAKIKTLSTLKTLFMYDTKVTADGVASLRAELPKLKVRMGWRCKGQGQLTGCSIRPVVIF